MTFGEALRRAREAKRYSIVASAEMAGVQASQWSRAEADEPKRSDGSPPIPSIRTVEKYLKGLNLNLAFEEDRELLRSIYAQTPYSIKEPIWTEERPYTRNDPNHPINNRPFDDIEGPEKLAPPDPPGIVRRKENAPDVQYESVVDVLLEAGLNELTGEPEAVERIKRIVRGEVEDHRRRQTTHGKRAE